MCEIHARFGFDGGMFGARRRGPRHHCLVHDVSCPRRVRGPRVRVGVRGAGLRVSRRLALEGQACPFVVWSDEFELASETYYFAE